MTYRLQNCNGVMVEGEWDTINDIPDTIMDKWDHTFYTDSFDVIQCSDGPKRNLGSLCQLRRS